MLKHFLFLFFLALSLTIAAQQSIRQDLYWNPPTIIEWEGSRRVILSFTLGPDGAGTEKSGELPAFVHVFPGGSGAPYDVEIVSLKSEPFPTPPGFSAEPVTDFSFAYSPVRQPQGWLGKISGPAIIRTPVGLERLLSVELRLVPSVAASSNTGRSTFAANSVLREGDIYRVAVTATGVHKISRAFLADQLKVTNLNGIDPRDIKIFGQPGGMLPETVNDMPPDDLYEQAIYIEGEGDGSFDGGDYILFHAEGPDERRYDPLTDRFVYTNNIYTDRSYYYLQIGTPGRGRRVSPLPNATNGAVTDTYDALFRYEEDKYNVLHELGGNNHGSGQTWFGEFFKVSRQKDFPNLVTFPDLVTDQPLWVRSRMGLRSAASSRFFLEVNGAQISSTNAAAVVFGAEEQRSAVIPTELVGTAPAAGDRVNVSVVYPVPAGTDRSEGWLDWIDIRGRRRLTFANQDQFSFRDTKTVDGAAVTFKFGGSLPTDARVWRIDGLDVREATLAGAAFTAPAGGKLYEYVAFRAGSNLLIPEAIGKIPNQNLHATREADMIIVTHPDFLAQAEKLAEHRRAHNGFTVPLVTTQQIYHEFSGGRDDPAAIRNFARMVYERDPSLRYLLLFGDGSFDHRNIYQLGTNFIPVYEHEGAFTQVKSFPADDFYGIMTPAVDGQPLAPDLSIAVGRLPIKSADEAGPVVEKLIRYDTDPSAFGDWRTRMVFVGDDEDGGKHTIDVNRVANAVEQRKPDLNFDKLYFDLFPQQSLSSGDRYPDITEGLDRAVFRGALAVTYLGHGGPRGWAQERVLTIPQIRNWTRPAGSPDPIQPPVFITATCTFSNYDDASFVSAGEEALLTPRGGVIALMTTTRPVFATRNYELTNNTVQAMLDRPDGEWRSLGDIIRIAKNETTPVDRGSFLSGDTENARKYTLLGDPATVIAFPRHGVRTTFIDTLAVDSMRTDTVRALQKMRISGEIVDVTGNLLSNFNGQVYPTIYDKEQTVPTLQQDSDSPLLQIGVQRNIVFRGRATVTNGKFSFEFVVPSDIDYDFGPAKISYYAADRTQRTDAAGYYDQLIIGGTGTDTNANDEGPTVDVYLDDTDFVAGGQVGEDPVLLLHLSDDLGINVTGNSIGHDLEAVLDEDSRNAIVLNDYYEADVDDFRSGKVRYPLFDLKPGLHTVTVRAWDVANNSSVATTEFLVATDIGDALSHVLNYPNPFTTSTCFQFDHTLVGQEVTAIVQIFTVSGKLVKTLEAGFPFSDGSVRQDDCIAWDGLDDYGDPLARGVYLYQVRLLGDGNNVVNGELEKLVILR
ncbi:type IX secretion system sortase PorU [Neolewinella litorea]|uniref:Type IX secretion system sortase PorU n=1 Tax=Neolewinella litorea TaxID=2562452 RepID=A0A4S4NAH8_9BACT|nr:type IX secretion system sortase PorU [Neolewinella litorea]THH36336.1 type IX secretion system sortase PorU [Neolewinella litorea]